MSNDKAAANRDALMHNLNVALSTPAKVDDMVTLQSQYVVALIKVADFLKAFGASEEIVFKFVGLADAIGQLRNGTVADVVRPAEVGGRGPDGIVAWSLRADVIVGLECILRSHRMKGKNEVALHIANKYPVFDRLKRDAGDSLKASLLSWRRRISEGKVPSNVCDDIQKYQRTFFEEHDTHDDMYVLGEQLLSEAAERTAKAVF